MLKALLTTKVYFQFPVNFRYKPNTPDAKKIKDNKCLPQNHSPNIPKQKQPTIQTQGKITLT